MLQKSRLVFNYNLKMEFTDHMNASIPNPSEEFYSVDAGASLTEKVEAQKLKPGSFIMIKAFPCKVLDVRICKDGKHGSAKVIIKGKDILTNNVMGCYFHSGDMVDAPIVDKTEYVVANIEEQQLELLDKNGNIK